MLCPSYVALSIVVPMIHPPNDPTFQGDLPELALDQRRQLFRLSGHHFLTTARLIAGAVDRDLVTAITFLCIGRANLKALTVDSQRATAYAGLATIPPDGERTPVSVYAVAKELGIPYETIRRHTRKLRDADLLEVVAGGLIIPARAFLHPGLLGAVTEYWQGTVAFVNAAAEAGIVAPGPEEAPPPDVSRQVMRLGVNHFLEMMIRMARTVDSEPVTAVVMRAIGFANVRHVTIDPGLAAAYASMLTPPPGDAERRPVSVYALSKSLMLPYETTRRHAQRLLDRGLVRRAASGGLYIPADVVTRPEIVEGMSDAADLALTYLSQLARYGVVARAPAPGPA